MSEPETPLVPCPSCGHKNPWYEVETKWEGDDFYILHYLECSNCHVRTASYEDSDIAEDDWNAGKVTKPGEAK